MTTQAYIQEELDKWSLYGVEGHFKPIRPWVSIDETVEGGASRLLGATPQEVVVMNTLSTNLHLLMVSFYTPTKSRYKIVVEAKAFPSDAVRSSSAVRRPVPHSPRDHLCPCTHCSLRSTRFNRKPSSMASTPPTPLWRCTRDRAPTSSTPTTSWPPSASTASPPWP